jgi:hypothetical protein
MDAPERIYTNKNGTAIITPPAIPLHETDIEWVPSARISELEAENARLRGAADVAATIANGALDLTAREATLRRDLCRVRDELRAALAALNYPHLDNPKQ